ncbi:asparagine synthase (glutamine-hydrolyzing) [Alphaproteobacteria bacterium]|nr:asparagine synthase (glutamine-hydrolyzing) [Alphaproteobacteria bacterium]
MCGIAGIVQLKGDLKSLNRIDEMAALVAHRGPDGQGSVIVGNVALGHRRLAIIDLSDQGAQPMSSSDGQLHITYNGEIYNFLELREELIAHGYKFAGNSDTEVLLNAYRQWGEYCLDRLNGMWSFAILDVRRNIVFCSRDRFGEKPFYYHQSEMAFLFGSEIRQLLPELDEVIANKPLLERFIVGGTGEDVFETFFRDIYKLPAGHNLVFDLTKSQMKISAYYDLKRRKSGALRNSDNLQNEFKSLFLNSTKLRLRSDVVVGTCLSGGLDSSSIASVAAAQTSQLTSKPFKAITAASTDPERDESGFAKIVAEANTLDLHVIKPDYHRFKTVTREVVRAQEEPFGSASIIMQFEVMRAAARHGIKVLLDGQGADEILLGYDRYFAPYLRQMQREQGPLYAYKQARRIANNNAAVSLFGLVKYYLYFNFAFIRKLKVRAKFRHAIGKLASGEDINRYAASSMNFFDLQKYELTVSNLPSLLRFEDKNSMWHSVETRLPFLDYRLVEFCYNLPVDAKISDGWTKRILRSSMMDILPKAIVWRVNKFGFEAPQSDWVERHQTKMLSTIKASKLLKMSLRNEQSVNKISKNQDVMWKLYIIALWEEEFNVSSAI